MRNFHILEDDISSDDMANAAETSNIQVWSRLQFIRTTLSALILLAFTPNSVKAATEILGPKDPIKILSKMIKNTFTKSDNELTSHLNDAFAQLYVDIYTTLEQYGLQDPSITTQLSAHNTVDYNSKLDKVKKFEYDDDGIASTDLLDTDFAIMFDFIQKHLQLISDFVDAIEYQFSYAEEGDLWLEFYGDGYNTLLDQIISFLQSLGAVGKSVSQRDRKPNDRTVDDPNNLNNIKPMVNAADIYADRNEIDDEGDWAHLSAQHGEIGVQINQIINKLRTLNKR